MNQNSWPDIVSMVLYKSPICGFCFRVTRFIKRQGIEIKMRDTFMDAGASAELMAGGGRSTVPCLRIEQMDGGVEWMYESLDIIDYLTQWVNKQP